MFVARTQLSLKNKRQKNRTKYSFEKNAILRCQQKLDIGIRCTTRVLNRQIYRDTHSKNINFHKLSQIVKTRYQKCGFVKDLSSLILLMVKIVFRFRVAICGYNSVGSFNDLYILPSSNIRLLIIFLNSQNVNTSYCTFAN